jgi:hypothetical protein
VKSQEEDVLTSFLHQKLPLTMRIFYNLFRLIFVLFSFTSTFGIGGLSLSNGVLTYSGEVAFMDSVHLAVNGSNVQVQVFNGVDMDTTLFPVVDVGQFRFTNKEHMDKMVKDPSFSIPVEMIHYSDEPKKNFEMVALFDLVKYIDVTHKTVQSGDWSDPNTWGGVDLMPRTGDRVLIRMGDTVTIDDEFFDTYMTIRVDGMLRYSPHTNTRLQVNTMVVGMHGSIEMGKIGMPIPKQYTAKLIIDKLHEFELTDETSPDYDPFKLGLGLIAHGSIAMFGAKKLVQSSCDDLAIGAASVTLDQTPFGWEVGDEVVVSGTQLDGEGDEKRFITGVSGNTVYFDTPLTKDHLTPTHTKAGLTLKIHVANITRNVTIETSTYNRGMTNASEFDGRGHVMFMHTNDVNINYVGFNFLGRTNKQASSMENAKVDSLGNILSVASNPVARYPCHFHRAGMSGVMGYINGCAVYDSPGWAYVNHGSAVNIVNNVAYDIDGASFVSERGDELGSFVKNISIRTLGNGVENNTADPEFGSDGPERAHFEVTHFGSAGDGYWIHSEHMRIDSNIASGFTGAGFQLWHQGIDGLTLDLNQPGEFEPILVTNNLYYGGAVGLSFGFVSDNIDQFHTFKNEVIYNVVIGVRRKYTSYVLMDNMTLIGDIDHPYGWATRTHSNGKGAVYKNCHVEGFVEGLTFPFKNTTSGIYGGYLNNVRNCIVGIRHDRDQSLICNGDIDFGTLDPSALAGVDLTNFPYHDGNQYDYYGIEARRSTLDPGFVEPDPSTGEGEISTIIIEHDSVLRKVYLEQEQHPSHIPWPTADSVGELNWLGKTNATLMDESLPEAVYSGEYYDTLEVLTLPANDRLFNLTLKADTIAGTDLPTYNAIQILEKIGNISIPLDSTIRIDLHNHYQALLYHDFKSSLKNTTTSSNGTIIQRSLSNDTLIITGVALGMDSLRVKCEDLAQQSSSIKDTVQVIVTDTNLAPVAEDVIVSTRFNTPIDIPLTFYDIDQNVIKPTVETVTPGFNGVFTRLDTVLTYVPNIGFVGTDSCSYIIRDVFGTKDTGWVKVVVESEIVDHFVHVDEGGTVDLSLPSDLVSAIGDGDGQVSFVDSVLTYYQHNGNHDGVDTINYSTTHLSGTIIVSISNYITPDNPQNSQATIFEDGFESGTFTYGNFITTGNCNVVGWAKYTDTLGAVIKNANGTITKTVSTLDYTHIKLEYNRMIKHIEGTEYAEVAWSTDSIVWNTLEYVDGSDTSLLTVWESKSHDLPGETYDSPSLHVQFKLVGGSSDQLRLDDVHITGIPSENGVLVQPEVTVEDQEFGIDYATGDDYDFGVMLYDTIPIVKTFIVNNEGNYSLELANLHLASGANGFQLITDPDHLPSCLSPGVQAYVDIAFDPTDAPGMGVLRDTLNFETNDPDEPNYSINLSLELVPCFDVQDTLNTMIICGGDSVEIFGDYQSVSGIYYDSLITVNGCDSVIVQELIVHPVSSDEVLPSISLCEGDSTMIFGDYQFVSGIYYDSLITVNGCDSVIVQELIVHPVSSDEVLPSISLCEGDSTLIFGNYQSTSGIYYDSLVTVNGCDSVIVQELIVHPVPPDEVLPSISLCEGDSTLIFGDYQSVSGMYYDSLITVNGCDSVIVQELIVHPVPSDEVLPSISLCEGDSTLIFGNYQSVSGMYYDSLVTVNGCDSVIVQELIVYDLPIVAFTELEDEILCLGSGSVMLDGTPNNGSFVGEGVDNDLFDPDMAGVGIHTLYYSFEDTNSCSNYDSVQVEVVDCLGINENANETIKVYPNPFHDFTTIYFDQMPIGSYSIVVHDLIGKEVYRWDGITESSVKIWKRNLSGGVFLLSVLDQNQNKIEVVKLVVK